MTDAEKSYQMRKLQMDLMQDVSAEYLNNSLISMGESLTKKETECRYCKQKLQKKEKPIREKLSPA
jgi:hypothetical protein